MNHFTFKQFSLFMSLLSATLVTGCAIPVYDTPSYSTTTIRTFPSNSTATFDSFDNSVIYPPSNTIIYNRPPVYYTSPIQIAPPIIIPLRPHGYYPHNYRPPYRPGYRPGPPRPNPNRPHR